MGINIIQESKKWRVGQGVENIHMESWTKSWTMHFASMNRRGVEGETAKIAGSFGGRVQLQGLWTPGKTKSWTWFFQGGLSNSMSRHFCMKNMIT